jgi:hypothetical protein
MCDALDEEDSHMHGFVYVIIILQDWVEEKYL